MTENFDYYRKGENKHIIKSLIKKETTDEDDLIKDESSLLSV